MRYRPSLTPDSDTNEHSDGRIRTDAAKRFAQVEDVPGHCGCALQARGS
jgi:hypothetical protein